MLANIRIDFCAHANCVYIYIFYRQIVAKGGTGESEI